MTIYTAKRLKTREVMVGHIGVGGDNPVRIQSMTTSSTRDVDATIDQVIRLADAGCEIVRVTVQGMKEAEACEGIKNGLIQKGYNTPLVADIHFFPPAALKVVDFVEKVRVNPGNFVDKRASFKIIEYDDMTYAEELAKIDEKFTPLVLKCKQLKRAMRIGANHGSLSDRIMNRYGDTPVGMVESAFEFARVCRKNDYHDFIFSMKASNPQVMIQAYRLLVAEMLQLGWDYPIHLGVTEAGLGEDGRIKSAIGIGSLLMDGIGDTIRVSLTEDPWHEIEPCQRLIKLTAKPEGVFRYANSEKRKVIYPQGVAMHRNGTVIVTADPHNSQQVGYDTVLGQIKLKSSTADMVFTSQGYAKLTDAGIGILSSTLLEGGVQLQKLQDAAMRKKFTLINHPHPVALNIEDDQNWNAIKEIQPSFIVLSFKENRIHQSRQFFEWAQKEKISCPVIFHYTYSCDKEDLILKASIECGALFCEGLGDGLWLEGPYEPEFLRQLSFNILQASRMRSSKTDFISCPSCGRTLFDLQDVTKRIKSRTAHLPGVKIAIMGCIVNGPGEMADADFGYVGSKPGKIDLYVGKECVEKDIDFAHADDRLINLIKSQGKWQDPQNSG